jgi:hypothetical protein
MDATVLALVLTLIGMLATAIWTVAMIKNSTTKLTVEIGHLASAYDRLAKALEHLARASNDHETRLALLEQQRHRSGRD